MVSSLAPVCSARRFGPILLATWLGLTLSLVASAAPAAKAARPPNFIVIMGDDLGYGDLGSYGQKRLQTPNIDRLAAEGMRFTQHYSGSPVCAPARSVFLTGLHTGRTPIRGNREVKPEGQQPLPAETLTLTRSLQQDGYVTGVFGKWGLSGPGSTGAPENQGFDRFFGYNCQRLAHHYYPEHLWDNATRIELPGNRDGGRAVYAPELIHRRTLEFIEANREQPFFLLVATPLPHADLDAPDDYLARHRGLYGEETPYRGVDHGPKFRQGPYISQPTPKAAYAAMINVLDDQVGDIIATVERLGLTGDTLIIFTSDNGPAGEGGGNPANFDSSGDLRGAKRDVHEGGIRVPMIARWPGQVPPGVTSDLVCAGWDFFPTFVDLAGQRTPTGLDGISLVPTLTGRGEQVRHAYLYWEFHELGGRQALRQGPWKLVRHGAAQEDPGPFQLYNIECDPQEKTDLAATHPLIVADLAALLPKVRTESPVFKFHTAGHRPDN